MNNLEPQLLSLLDALRRDVDVGTVRSGVAALADAVRALPAADPSRRGLYGLFEYLDETTEDAAAGGAAWRAQGRVAMENALRAALSANRRDGSVLTLACVRAELERLAARITALTSADRNPLHALLSYVDMKNRQSLALAIRRDWGEPGVARRFEMRRDEIGTDETGTDETGTDESGGGRRVKRAMVTRPRRPEHG
ncbi:hypothetical protein [Nocardia sp. BMG51109]|uniref:hypothetical protein n=1 Tax=Nocardia sp. BMG51109 TaxID=1056816 RepID=UPI000467766D|nr:hypothetical protein [Nocardia sp. BMG51109]